MAQRHHADVAVPDAPAASVACEPAARGRGAGDVVVDACVRHGQRSQFAIPPPLANEHGLLQTGCGGPAVTRLPLMTLSEIVTVAPIVLFAAAGINTPPPAGEEADAELRLRLRVVEAAGDRHPADRDGQVGGAVADRDYWPAALDRGRASGHADEAHALVDRDSSRERARTDLGSCRRPAPRRPRPGSSRSTPASRRRSARTPGPAPGRCSASARRCNSAVESRRFIGTLLV